MTGHLGNLVILVAPGVGGKLTGHVDNLVILVICFWVFSGRGEGHW